MTSRLHPAWRNTFAQMKRIRPAIEQRARRIPGLLRANIAREWRLELTNMLNL